MSESNDKKKWSMSELINIAEDYLNNPADYLNKYTVRFKGKKRDIITYNQAKEKGVALRILHRKFAKEIAFYYESAPNSYAYKKGVGILQCLNKHMQSNTFLKTDIHEFFHSISYEILYKLILEENPNKRKKRLELLLRTCFYKDHLPVGFITSPILSDLFLHKVDERFLDREYVIYTRYSDDFIISGRDNIDVLQQVKEELETILSEYGLELNRKKTYFRTLRQPGDAIHLLGVNLVNDASKPNRITISDKYIRQTSKDICKFLDEFSELGSDRIKEERASLYGKVEFIRHFSSSSLKKLERMVEIKRGEKVDFSRMLRNP